MSEGRADEIIESGGFPQANILVGTVVVDMKTGEVSMENSDTWNLSEG